MNGGAPLKGSLPRAHATYFCTGKISTVAIELQDDTEKAIARAQGGAVLKKGPGDYRTEQSVQTSSLPRCVAAISRQVW